MLGCVFALPGALLGTVLATVVLWLTGSLDGEDGSVLPIFVLTPILAWAVGMAITTGYDRLLVRVTELGSPIERLRGPGQILTAILAAITPALVAMVLLLGVPSLVVPGFAVMIVVAYGPMFVSWVWEIVK